MTTLQLAEQFFKKALESGKRSVSNVDLHRYITERNGQTRQVIGGTLDQMSHGSLVDSLWYTTNWHRERVDGRTHHCRNNGTSDITVQREMSYDFPAKRETCRKIMEYLPATGTPRLLTLASSHGNCVQAAVKRNPNVQTYNVESRRDILDVWKTTKDRLGIQTWDYNCTFQDFVRAPGFTDCRYALINADVMGYVCKTMFDYMQVINEAGNADVVAITTQCLDSFRNHGAFQDALRKKYAGKADKQGECMADWMHNYDMVDRWTYRKMDGSRRMEVFIFQLEGL
jgi:hypothetical protein